MFWHCGKHHRLDPGKQGVIMGILNVTPDSFSDGGSFNSVSQAAEHAFCMFDEGAAIVDIGGESTRPGADPVDVSCEMERVLPVIKSIIRQRPQALLSIDTSKALVARAACEAGVAIINDVTGLIGDAAMASVVAETGAGLVIMHAQGDPRTMQDNPSYQDVVKDVRDFFQRQVQIAVDAGVKPDAIALDPGIGFGKSDKHNITLLRHLSQLMIEPHPLLIGVSRKSFIGRLLNHEDPDNRASATCALTALTRSLGAVIHRVHDVRANLDALRMAEVLLEE
ncbi:MAG: dihydropteroate synthase [Verrucomicrobiota bacterium]